MGDFLELDLVGVADGVRGGNFSSEEVTKWSLERLETLGKRYNAVFGIDRESALTRARNLDQVQARSGVQGPLHGVPMAHKDLFHVAGRERHAGSLVLTGMVSNRNAPVIDELENAGQVNVGTLHMGEFAFSPTGFNEHYGSGRNPWDPDRICGGSSSGSAIAVAGRMVFGSLGGDTAGSIRLPAAMCGVTGLKPTFRAVNTQGTVPVAFSLDCIGPIAQSARDCARLLSCISNARTGKDPKATSSPGGYEADLDENLQGLRVGVIETFYRDGIDGEVVTALDASLDVLKQCRAEIVNSRIPDIMTSVNALCQLVMSVEAATLHRKWIQSCPEKYSVQVRNRIEQGFAYSAVRYAEALCLREKMLAEYIDSAFSNCDVLHVPVVPIVTPTIDETTQGQAADVQETIGRIGQLTRGINYLGLPAISVPAGFSRNGTPVSYQLIGRPFSEGVLLKIAYAYQQRTQWHRMHPFS